MTLSAGQVARAEDVVAAISTAAANAANTSAAAVATVTALRALTSSSSYTIVALASGSAVDDGRGGIFILNASDTTSTDNGGTIIVDAAGRRWHRLETAQGRINVRWLGAKGDGTTDDTTPIHNADVIAKSLNSSVYFPAGTYMVHAATTNDTGAIAATAAAWIGDGKNVSIIKSMAVPWSNSGSAMVMFTSFDNFVVSDLAFDMSGATFTAGSGNPGNVYSYLSIVGCKNWLVTRCSFLGIQAHTLGVAVNGGDLWQVCECYFNMPTPIGTAINQAINVSITVSNMTYYEVNDNVMIGSGLFTNGRGGNIHDNYATGVKFGAGLACGPDPDIHGMRFTDNVCSYAAGLDVNSTYCEGIECWASYSLISGNICSYNSGAGIFAVGVGNTITGNSCFNNSQGTTGWGGITLGQSPTGPTYYTENTTVSNNNLFDTQTTPTQSYGINEFGSFPAFIANNSYYNNVCANNVTAPVSLSSSPLLWSGPKYTAGPFAVTPGTIGVGASYSTTLTVPGARLGDFVRASYTQNLQGIELSGYASATNAVTVYFRSLAGLASTTLSSGNVFVQCERNPTGIS